MKTILQLLSSIISYGSVVAVLSLLMLGGYVWWNYGWNQEKTFRMMAAVYNVNLTELQEKQFEVRERKDHEDIAYEDVLRERAMATLDHDLRQQSISKGLADLRLLQRDLVEERKRYDLLKSSFDAELSRLEGGYNNQALLELEQTLEALKPKQAKDHVVRMLPAEFAQGQFVELADDQRKAVIHVVTIIKTMPLDKRKKLLAEFKTEEEATLLAELLRLIRLGVPEVDLINDTRDKLQEFNAN